MFVLLIAFLPVAFIPALWATLPHAKIILIAVGAGVGMALYVLARFFEGSASFPKSWIAFGAVLLPLVYTISAVWAGAGRTSYLGAGVESDTVATIFLWTMMLLLAVFVFRTRPQLIRLEQVLISSAGLLALFHIVRLTLGANALTLGGIFTDVTSSVVGSWHDLAIFLGLVLFLVSTLLASAGDYTGRIFTWFARALALASLALLVIINMSDVWVALAALSIVSFIGLFFYEWRAQTPFSYAGFFRKGSLLLLLLTASIVFSVWGKQIHDMLPAPIRIDSIEVRPSWEGTFSVALRSSGAESLLGSGPNTFTRQWGLYKPAGVNETAFWNADFAQGVGLIPTSLVSVGIVGLLAWIFFLVAILYEGMRIILKSPRDVQPIIASIALGAVYLWALAVVYNPGIAIIALAFLLTGALVGWGMHTGALSLHIWTIRKADWQGFAHSVILILLACLSLGVSGLVLRTISADMLVNRGIVLYNTDNSDIAGAQASVDKALRIDPANQRANRAALELGILEAARLMSSQDPNATILREQLTRTISSAIQYGLTAVSVDSADYQNWVALARVYEQLVGAQVDGAYANAEQAYKNAIERNPTNPRFHLNLAQLAIAKKDLNSAEQHLLEAIKLKPNFAAALFLASQVAASKGDAQGALITANAAAQAAPQEPVAWFQLGTLLLQTGKNNEARQALERAVGLNGNYANAIYVLGLAYAALDMKKEALAAMARVLELNPGNEQVKSAIAQIENIGMVKKK